MASGGVVFKLQAKAGEAAQFVGKQGAGYYKQLLERNKQYVQHPPTLDKCSILSKQLFYTRLASVSARYEAFWKEASAVKTKRDWKVEDAGIATLFGLECFAWFTAGEIAGRGFTITGYPPL